MQLVVIWPDWSVGTSQGSDVHDFIGPRAGISAAAQSRGIGGGACIEMACMARTTAGDERGGRLKRTEGLEDLQHLYLRGGWRREDAEGLG